MDMTELALVNELRAFNELDKARQLLTQRRNEALAVLQGVCPHSTILEYPDRKFGGQRVCKICGIIDNQSIATYGDEYDYAVYGSYAKLNRGKVTVVDLQTLSPYKRYKV
jgi:hypothetical protein